MSSPKAQTKTFVKKSEAHAEAPKCIYIFELLAPLCRYKLLDSDIGASERLGEAARYLPESPRNEVCQSIKILVYKGTLLLSFLTLIAVTLLHRSYR